MDAHRRLAEGAPYPAPLLHVTADDQENDHCDEADAREANPQDNPYGPSKGQNKVQVISIFLSFAHRHD